MKSVYNKDQRLESHRFFGYIAWTLIVLFAFFVYNITVELKATTSELQQKVDSIEAKVNASPETIDDFEN